MKGSIFEISKKTKTKKKTWCALSWLRYDLEWHCCYLKKGLSLVSILHILSLYLPHSAAESWFPVQYDLQCVVQLYSVHSALKCLSLQGLWTIRWDLCWFPSHGRETVKGYAVARHPATSSSATDGWVGDVPKFAPTTFFWQGSRHSCKWLPLR